jgi:N-methylhydantoinase A/oxoprolinase/acetone carboxylase beta subunit
VARRQEDMYTVDIDVGGTLTDGLFSDGQSAIAVKVDTTPHDLTVCFKDCLTEGARQFGFNELSAFLDQVHLIRWSTTITSNVLAQRSGAKLGLFVSKGHERDLYTHNGQSPVLNTLVDESNVIGLARPIDSQSVLMAVKTLLENGVRRICISMDGAFQDAADEKTMKQVIEGQYPDHVLGTVPVLLGSDLSHYPSDTTRTHHSLINAYVHAPLANALYKAEDDLRAEGYERPLLIGHANGGVARVSKTKALDTLESGPTMGLFGAAHFARLYGLPQVVTLDVGGTTSKVGIIRDGRVAMSNQVDILGIPIDAPGVLMHSIALGGGSVIHVDPVTRQLRLGPESMGAYPGPACYDLGGMEPTLTDALLTLKWLNPEYFLGGTRTLNTQRAHEALEQQVARPLGISVEQAALDATNVAFQMVADAFKEMLGRVDWLPGETTLFAFGGNGSAFACSVAERVGISQVYVFDLGPVFSAFGSSISDIVHVYEHGLALSLSNKDAGQHLAAFVERMRKEALHDMKGEGFLPAQVQLELEVELAGMTGSLTSVHIPVDATGPLDLHSLQEEHRQDTVELLRLRATSSMSHYEPAQRSLNQNPPTDALKGQRGVVWGRESGRTSIYMWEGLRPGQTVPGGAIIESARTTYPVPPGWTLRVDAYGNGHLTRR